MNLIQQLEAKIESMAAENCSNDPSLPNYGWERDRHFYEQGAHALMPLIEFQHKQFFRFCHILFRNKVIFEHEIDDLIKSYDEELLKLLNKDEK